MFIALCSCSGSCPCHLLLSLVVVFGLWSCYLFAVRVVVHCSCACSLLVSLFIFCLDVCIVLVLC